MSKLSQAIDRLDRLKRPSDLSFDRGGKSIIACVNPASRERGESFQSRIWRFTLDGDAVQLTHGPNGDYLPRCSPIDDRIAFASDRTTKGKADLFMLKKGSVRPIGRIPGTIEDLRWSTDGTAIFVLAADAGLDHPATQGAERIWWGGDEDPVTVIPGLARRRLFRVSTSNGTTTEIGPSDQSVWEFDIIDNDTGVVLASSDASERGWYHATIARLDFRTRTLIQIYSSQWQMQSPVASPSGKRIAFVEGWASDRGLVSGEIRIIELASGKVHSLANMEFSNATSLFWRDDESLWFAGWSKLGTAYGVVNSDGSMAWNRREDAMIGPNSFFAMILPAPDRKGFAAIREAVSEPPEIVFKADAKAPWKKITKLNTELMAGFDAYPEVRAISWKGPDGLELEGLLLLPKDRKPGPCPMVVDIHGGPTWGAKHAFDPGYALTTAAAGYVTFLPNYRGSSGCGQKFARLNIGDAGGAEFEDIMAGIDWCIAERIADPNKLGVTGVSYGGYMTAWAVARSNRFKAAVMISGISNQVSCHYSCNHDYAEFLFGGPLTDPKIHRLAIDRSPVYRLEKPATHTLIIHGDGDRCVPLGQAHEFYNALLERGAHAEIVIYPREGHGVQEREHQADRARRTTAWFDRYLGSAP